MKILMSAFSCGPGCGSEPGIGWNWALEAARQGHTVTVITQFEFKDRIEAEIAAGRIPPGVSFDFFMPGWLDWIRVRGCQAGLETATWQLVHLLWQIQLLGYVRARYGNERFDIVHHITLGGIRHPTLLGKLPFPLVLGPLGGGERAPLPLRKSLGWGPWLKDIARDVHTWLLRFDPITRSACSDAMIIYARTKHTKSALPHKFAEKTRLRLELGTPKVDVAERQPRRAEEPLRLMYAGQLVFWKGLHLGLRAVAEARRAGHNIELTIVGSGPDGGAFKDLVTRLGLDDCVTWRGQVPHAEIGNYYLRSDVFLFPSLHDSSGNVVLEALVRGLPVICLDCCGPADIVTETAGRIIATDGVSEGECVARLADAICDFARSPELGQRLSNGAFARSRQFLWPVVVSELYHDVEACLAVRRSVPAASGKAQVRLAPVTGVENGSTG